MNQHGGAREGAGRKKIKDKKITKAVSLSPALIEEAMVKYPGKSFSAIVEKALTEFLKESKE